MAENILMQQGTCLQIYISGLLIEIQYFECLHCQAQLKIKDSKGGSLQLQFSIKSSRLIGSNQVHVTKYLSLIGGDHA